MSPLPGASSTYTRGADPPAQQWESNRPNAENSPTRTHARFGAWECGVPSLRTSNFPDYSMRAQQGTCPHNVPISNPPPHRLLAAANAANLLGNLRARGAGDVVIK
jgi:hypothetical protein